MAVNGQDAVEMVCSGRFDLVLMDVQMPLMDGLEATRQIRTWEGGLHHIPIVGLTAVLDSEHRTCLESGMDSIISKPFDTEEFFETLEALMQKKQLPLHAPGQPADSAPAVLDAQAAVQRFAGDRGHYAELLSEFVMSLGGRLQELHAAHAAEDWETLSNRAHNLKGLSANFGAMSLSGKALALEQFVHAGDHARVKETLAEVEAGIEDVRGEASAFISSTSTG